MHSFYCCMNIICEIFYPRAFLTHSLSLISHLVNLESNINNSFLKHSRNKYYLKINRINVTINLTFIK